ncbi:hypothetical protein A6A06_14680 [Streptomyces sp. CB02923]|uniref:hypothetical protein n=1 Tax=Streptomyces sp. CB02923 TaxID=1718985 RepID=UPI00093E93A8|nr:hypothetical protein [Streptomyces sp. CB02923]OKI02296.1 hypothetical protein A6A06_14680 [Streptomyces sp. CB02923]
MARRRKNLLDIAIDRTGDINKDTRKALRRGFRSKKKKKSTQKLARRNNRDIRALTAQIQYLTHHMAADKNPANDK